MGSVVLNSVRKSYGDAHVIKDVSLTIPDGSFTVFVGPSGCGKSTLLRLIAGELSPTSGTLSTSGEVAFLTDAQRYHVLQEAVAMVHGRVPVLAHVGEISTHQTIALGKAVEKLGVAAVSVVAPSFVACSQDELVAHYSRVADALSERLSRSLRRCSRSASFSRVRNSTCVCTSNSSRLTRSRRVNCDWST